MKMLESVEEDEQNGAFQLPIFEAAKQSRSRLFRLPDENNAGTSAELSSLRVLTQADPSQPAL